MFHCSVDGFEIARAHRLGREVSDLTCCLVSVLMMLRSSNLFASAVISLVRRRSLKHLEPLDKTY